MAGEEFNFNIHRCTAKTPVWNNVATEMEGMKKKRRLKSTLPKRAWEIEIRMRNAAERDEILAHFNANYGINGETFLWRQMPSFYGTLEVYVCYIGFEYSNPQGLGTHWDFNITFEEIVGLNV
jgi:hypothetical protein